jgi:succinoglycan biosynthesis transport protein ExoP
MQGGLKPRWVWITVYVAYVALVIAAAAAYWRVASPTYEVSAIISVKPGLYGVETATVRADQNVRSQVALLESEDVIRQTIGAVGAAELYPNQEARGNLIDVISQIVAAVGAAELYPNQGADGYLTAEDRAYIAAKRKLAVRYEPQTDIIRISFRHTSPHLAVDFVRTLVEKFTRRYFELYTNEKAVAFFWDQQKQSREEYVQTSNALAEFSVKHQTYNVYEQQKLLLEHQSLLETALLTTKGAIADKTAQVANIPAQLSQMRPVGRLPQVTGLTQRIAPSAEQQGQIDRLAADPPLLLVRVYQDTIAQLVKLQTELAGLQALAVKQEQAVLEQAKLLGDLAKKEAQFAQLRLAVDHARQNYELFTQKAQERQLEQDQTAARLSSVQVVQPATKPLTPVSPSLVFLCVLVLAIVLFPVGGVAVYHVARSANRSPFRKSDPQALPAAEGSILYHPAHDKGAAASLHGIQQ